MSNKGFVNIADLDPKGFYSLKYVHLATGEFRFIQTDSGSHYDMIGIDEKVVSAGTILVRPQDWSMQSPGSMTLRIPSIDSDYIVLTAILGRKQRNK